MPINLKILLLILGFVGMILILSMVNKKKIMLKHAIFWCLLVFLAMLATLFVEQLVIVANFLGIETASNMIFLGGFLVLLAITFLLSSTVSRQKLVLIKLTQEIALTNRKIEELCNDKNVDK